MSQAKPLLSEYRRYSGTLTREQRRERLMSIMKKTGAKAKDVAAIINVKVNTVRIWRMSNPRIMITYQSLSELYSYYGFDIATGEIKDDN